ncbi:MAG: twin-arginine translocase subunit TatC [Acetobacteraceae bacterium]|nr:twin-arginine translocase subunit TatC [Acetobacteraceae bacterium]
MPLMDHLIELRTRLIWAMVSFAVCFVVSYYFSDIIYYFLARPLAEVLKETGSPDPKLIYTQLYEAFFTRIKVAFFGGVFLGFPVIACQLWLFVAPGLYRSEKRALLPFLAATPVLFFLGASLAYFFVFPMAWRFFAGFQNTSGGGGVPIELLPKVGEYLDLVMKMIFAFGLTFQLPVGLSLMAKVGITSSAALRRYRRYAIVGNFVVAAVLAPPDPISMLLLAVPLIALYEISIIAASIVEPKPKED